MNEQPRRLYLLVYKAIDGSVRRAWYGSRNEALRAASQLKVDYEIAEAVI